MKFTIIDHATNDILEGYANVQYQADAFYTGQPMRGEKFKEELNVGESTRYIFRTGAGTTHATILRTE